MDDPIANIPPHVMMAALRDVFGADVEAGRGGLESLFERELTTMAKRDELQAAISRHWPQAEPLLWPNEVGSLRQAAGSRVDDGEEFELPMGSQVERRTTVMVVDDSLTMRQGLQNFLVGEGFDVVLAEDGLDALELFQHKRPDIMVVDIFMPQIDGFELLRRIHRNGGIEPPVVMMTSDPNPARRDQARELGATTLLSKPFSNAVLLKQLHEDLAAI